MLWRRSWGFNDTTPHLLSSISNLSPWWRQQIFSLAGFHLRASCVLATQKQSDMFLHTIYIHSLLIFWKITFTCVEAAPDDGGHKAGPQILTSLTGTAPTASTWSSRTLSRSEPWKNLTSTQMLSSTPAESSVSALSGNSGALTGSLGLNLNISLTTDSQLPLPSIKTLSALSFSNVSAVTTSISNTLPVPSLSSISAIATSTKTSMESVFSHCLSICVKKFFFTKLSC